MDFVDCRLQRSLTWKVECSHWAALPPLLGSALRASIKIPGVPDVHLYATCFIGTYLTTKGSRGTPAKIVYVFFNHTEICRLAKQHCTKGTSTSMQVWCVVLDSVWSEACDVPLRCPSGPQSRPSSDGRGKNCELCLGQEKPVCGSKLSKHIELVRRLYVVKRGVVGSIREFEEL